MHATRARANPLSPGLSTFGSCNECLPGSSAVPSLLQRVVGVKVALGCTRVGLAWRRSHTSFVSIDVNCVTCVAFSTELGVCGEMCSVVPLFFFQSRDSLLVRAPDSRSKGCEFESRQERRENFLLQSQLGVLTLYSVSVPPLCYRSGASKTPVILPKVQVTG